MNQYVKLSELTAEQFAKLPVCKFSIYQQSRNKTPGLYYYTMNVKLGDGLTLSFNLTQAEYFLLEAAFKQQRGLSYHLNLPCHYRVVSSVRPDGSKYAFFEAIFAEGIYKSDFLTDAQLKLIKVLGLNIEVEFFEQLKEDSLKPFGISEGEGA